MKKTLSIVRYALVSLFSFLFIGSTWAATQDEVGETPYNWITFNELQAGSVAANTSAANQGSNTTVMTLPAGTAVQVAPGNMAYQFGTTSTTPNFVPGTSLNNTTYVTFLSLNGGIYNNSKIWGANGQAYSGLGLCVSGSGSSYKVLFVRHAGGSIQTQKFEYTVPADKITGFHCYAVTVDGNRKCHCYVDGADVSGEIDLSLPGTGSQNNMFGWGQLSNSGPNNNVANGLQVSDFRVYQKVLTAEQLKTIAGPERFYDAKWGNMGAAPSSPGVTTGSFSNGGYTGFTFNLAANDNISPKEIGKKGTVKIKKLTLVSRDNVVAAGMSKIRLTQGNKTIDGAVEIKTDGIRIYGNKYPGDSTHLWAQSKGYYVATFTSDVEFDVSQDITFELLNGDGNVTSYGLRMLQPANSVLKTSNGWSPAIEIVGDFTKAEIAKATATISENIDWTGIDWDDDEPTEDSAIEITVQNNAVITLNHTLTYPSLKISGACTLKYATPSAEVLATLLPGRAEKVAAPIAETITGDMPTFTCSDQAGCQVKADATGLTYTPLVDVKARTININFAGGRNNTQLDNGSKLNNGEYATQLHGGFPMLGSKWNDLAAGSNTSGETLTAYDCNGNAMTLATAPQITVSKVANPYTTGGNHSVSDRLLFGYCDDGNDGPKAEISNIPFSKYRIYAYFSTDTTDKKLGYLKVTAGGQDTNYCGTTNNGTAGTTKHGTDAWGKSSNGTNAIDLGESINYLVTDVMTASSITLEAKKATDSRAGIAGYQIVDCSTEGHYLDVATTLVATVKSSKGMISWDDIDFGDVELDKDTAVEITVDDDANKDVYILQGENPIVAKSIKFVRGAGSHGVGFMLNSQSTYDGGKITSEVSLALTTPVSIDVDAGANDLSYGYTGSGTISPTIATTGLITIDGMNAGVIAPASMPYNNFTIAEGGKLQVNVSSAMTINGIKGAGTFIKTGTAELAVRNKVSGGFAVDGTTIQIDNGAFKLDGNDNGDAQAQNATFIIGANGSLTQYAWYNLYGTIVFENATDKTVFGANVRANDSLTFVKRGAGKLTFASGLGSGGNCDGIQALTVEAGQIHFNNTAVLSPSTLALDFSALDKTATPIDGDFKLATNTSFKFPSTLAENEAFTICTGTLSGAVTGLYTITVGEKTAEAKLTFDGNTVKYAWIGSASATISKDTKLSEINWVPAGVDPAFAKLTLTVQDGAAIILDGAFNCFSLDIIGDAKFVADDSVYENGCWEKKLLDAMNFSATGTISFGAIKDGFYGALTQTANGISLRAQNKEVISINIAGGNGGGAGADSPDANLVSGDGFYGIAPTLGSSWNNINKQWQSGGDQTITIEGPKAYDGNDVIDRPTMSLSATGQNTWQCGSISNPFLRGYLDDGSGVTVLVRGVPYTEYDVIVYATSDNASTPLAPITINGTEYTFKDGETTPGSDVWGVGQYATPEIGKNALRVNGCTGDTVTINAVRTGGRATLCAVQVINKGDVVIKQDFSATIDKSTKFSEINWEEGDFVEGQLNEVTITVADGEGEVEIEFDKPDMVLAKITITCDRPIKFKATAALPNVPQFIIDGCTGGITYAWPVAELKTVAGGVTYAANNGSEDAATPINFAVNDGSMTLKDATFYIGTTDSGTQSTVNMENATVYANGESGFGVGQGTFNLSGSTKLTSEKVILSQGGAGRTSNLTLSDSAEIVVTGSLIIDSNQSSIMFGHWDGPSTFTMGDNAKFTAENAQVLVGKTANNQTININGGVFTAKGIKASAGASGTNALNLNGGELKLGEYGITSYGTTTIPVTVAGNAQITSTAAMPITQAITVNEGKTLTFDATAGDITISTAVVNNGTIKVVGGNVIFLPGTFNGTITDEGTGKFIYGYTVTINDCGEFTVPAGVDPASVRLYRADGTVIENTTIKDGKILYTPELYGKNALMEYLFNGTLVSTGSDTGSLSFDGKHCFPNAEYVLNEEGEKAGGIYAASAPWRNLTFPNEVTVVMYGKVMKTDNTCQIGIGSTTGGSKYTLFLASGDVAKEEVVLGYAYKNTSSGDGVEKHDVLCRMTVPHAQTTDHLYAFTLKKVGDDTVVNIYLDGELLQPYVFKNQTVTLGNGIQLGSIHGGIGDTQDWPAGFGFKRSTDVETDATLNFVRVYNVELNNKVLRAIAADYPYQSPSGSFNRTLAGDENWIETGAWTKVGETEKYAEPDAGSSVTITPPEDAGVTLTSNLAEVKTFEAMTFNAGGKITVVKGEESTGEIVVSGRTTISTDTQISIDAMELGGAVAVAAGKTLTFDFTSLDLTKEFSNRSIRLTGTALLGDDAEIVATGITPTTGRTAEIVYDESTQQYSLAITVDQTIPFTYTDGAWTWGTQVVDADTVEANPDLAIVVASGTFQATAAPTAVRSITVNEGAVFDVNGYGSSNYAITLNGGELANTGDATFVPGLTLTANSSVNLTGNLSIQSSATGWAATTIALDEYTLAKKGEGQFTLVATTITGTGTLDIQSGKVYSSEATTFADGVMKIAAGATYQQRGGRSATIAKIIGVEGALLQNNSDNTAGTISAFTLEGAIKLVGTGNFGTITLDEATIDIATQRGLTLAGEGSVKATITAAEVATGSVTVFKAAEDADIDSVTLVDEAGDPLSGYTADYDEEGNYIANFTVTFTVPTIAGATPSIEGGTLTEGVATVAYGANATITYTANTGKLFTDGTTSVDILLENITDATTVEGAIATAIEGKSTDDAAAKIGTTYYLTLAEAITAVQGGETIELLANMTIGGISIPSGKNFVLEFNSKSITFECPGAGSAGTKTIGFQILEGSTIVFQNGTIQCSQENASKTWEKDSTEKGIAMIIQNYADLTLKGMQINGTFIAHNGAPSRYVLSINSGNVKISDSWIYATGDDFAFDTCDDDMYAGIPTVTVDGEGIIGSAIVGKVELSGGNLNLVKGSIDGELVPTAIGNGVITKADAFNVDAPESYFWKDGKLVKAEVKVNYETYCLTLKEAIADEDTYAVELLKDVELEECISISTSITLDIGKFNITPKGPFTTGTTRDALFAVNYGGGLDIDGTTGSIDCSSQPSIYAAIKMTEKGEIPDEDNWAYLTVIGGTIKGYYYGICGNGGRGWTGITIDGGTITAVAPDTNLAIYNPQPNSEVIINGGTLIGLDSAIEMRGGKLEVTGGTFTATATEYKVSASGNGNTTVGAAIAVAQHNTEGDIDVSIGNDTKLKGVKAVSVANPQGNETSNVEVALGPDATYLNLKGEKGSLAFSANGNATVWVDADIELPKGYLLDADGKLVKAPAKIGTKLYLTLADAVTAADGTEDIVLLADCTGNGIMINKSITIDFGGFTYTVNASLVGSPSTQSQAFNLVKGNTITLKNGTITSTVARMLVQNYANLTLDNMTLDGTNLAAVNGNGNAYVAYTLSNCDGDTVITGNSVINARVLDGQKSFAFDTYYQAGAYEDATVTVNGATINGNVELAGGSLTLTAGTLNGELVEGANIEKGAVTKGAAFEAAAPEGYEWDANGKLVKAGAARIGTTLYLTLDEAVKDAENGATITLLKNCGASDISSFYGKTELTFEGETADIVFQSPISGPRGGIATLNFKGLTINGFKKLGYNYYRGWQVTNENYEECTIQNCISTYSANCTLKDCLVTYDDNEYALWDYGCKNLVLDGCTFVVAGKAVKIYNEGAAADFSVYATGCTFKTTETRKSVFQLDVGHFTNAAAVKVAVDESCTLVGYTTGVEGGDPWIYSENDTSSFDKNSKGQFALGTDIVRDVNGKIIGGNFARISEGIIADGYAKVPNEEDPTRYDVLKVAAKIGTTYYLTLAEAITVVEAHETIELLDDMTIGGISIPSGKNFVLEFNEKTITFECPGAGSAGTQTLGFQILEGSTIIFQNGTIQCSEANKDATWTKDSAEKGIAMLIQNYANLSLENMIIDGTNIAHNGVPTRYVLSINSGAVSIYDTTIKAAEGDFAFDTCDDNKYEGVPQVTVDGSTYFGSSIEGNVELSGGNLKLVKGSIDGELVDGGIGDGVIIKGAAFDVVAPDGYAWNDEGYLIEASAKIGSIFYLTLADAVKAAKDNETVELLASCTGDGIKIDKSITIDFGGFVYTVDASLVGSPSTQSQAFNLVKGKTITLKNGTITSKVARMLVQNYANLTLKDMILDGSELAAVDGNGNDYVAYTLSNCDGDTVITGSTTIVARSLAEQTSFAFDTYYKAGKYEDATVTVDDEDVNIMGDIELAGGSLALNAGTLNGELVEGANIEKGTVTKSADFEADAPQGYIWDENGTLIKITLPTAQVTEITAEGYEAAVQFTADEIGVGYDDWNAKFVLIPNVAIGANEIMLGGSYEQFQEGAWIDLPFPACEANEEIDVLGLGSISVTVSDVFNYVNEFKCGVKNLALKNDATFTLKLVITDGETTKDICSIDNLTVAAKPVLPTATQDTTIVIEGCDLAVKYTLGTAAVGYDDWNVDFEVSSDVALEEGDFTLKGSNPLDGETMVDFSAFALKADTPVKLIATFAPDFKVTYAQLIELTHGTYTCAVVNNSNKQANVTVKIILSKEGKDDIVVEGSVFKGTLAKDYGIVISEDGKGLAVTGKGSADVAPTFTTKQKRTVEEAVIRDGVETVGKRFFKDFTKLNKVTVGKDVRTIGEKAFYKCMSLEKIVIENPDFDVTQLSDAVVYQLMLDEEGVPYVYPSIEVAGYTEMLEGKVNLTDLEWTKIGKVGTVSMQETPYRFFRVVLTKEPAQGQN